MHKRITLLLATFALFLGARTLQAAGEDDDYRRAHHLYKLTEYKLAAEAFDKFLRDYPKAEREHCEMARLLLAESLYQHKDLERAAQQFERFLSDFPASTRRTEALQRNVKGQWQIKHFDKSAQAAELFIKENKPRLGTPDEPPALRTQFEEVLYYGGDAYYAQKKGAQAKNLWETLQKDFPQSKLRPDAAEGLGWLAFEAAQYDEALKHFAIPAATAQYPRAAINQIMAARALDQLGKTDEALAALNKAAGLKGAGEPEQARLMAFWRPAFLLKAKRAPEAVLAYKALAQGFGAHADTPVALFQALLALDEQAQHAPAVELADAFLGTFAASRERAAICRVKARALNTLKKSDAALAAARQAVKEAEALPPTSPEYGEQRPASLMLLAEFMGASGKTHYETIAKEHAATRFAQPARYQLAFLAARDNPAGALPLIEKLLAELKGNEQAELHRKTMFLAADVAFGINQRDTAEKYLKQYAELPAVKAEAQASQLPLVLLRLAWCRHGAGDFTAAVTLLDQALANPPVDLRDEMLYLRGRALLDGQAKTGTPQSADKNKLLQDYKTLLKDAPSSDFTAHACLDAAQLLHKDAPAEALPWLDALLEGPAFARSPLRNDALLLRARTRYTLGKAADALADAEALLKDPALKRKEQAPAAHLLKAVCLEALPGQEAAADEAYSQLIEACGADAPESKLGIMRRARMRFNAKRFAEAQQDLTAFLAGKELRAEQTVEIEAAVLLAVCRRELKDVPAAQAGLEQLSRLTLSGPAAFEVPFQLGNIAYESSKHVEAAVQYQQALTGAQKIKELPLAALSAAWLNLAWSHKRANEPKKAEAAFGELLKLDPQGPFSAEARYYRARLLAEAGSLESALSLWNEVVDKQRSSPLAEKSLAAIGEAQAKASRFAEAAKSFDQYLTKFPKGDSVREVWCGLAECRLQLQDAPGARAAFLQALGAKATEGELDEIGERAVLGLSEMALVKGEAGECKKQALRVVIDRPDSKWLDAALYFCARASEDMAEPNQAIGYYRKLLQDRPDSERATTAKERLKALGAPASEK